MNSPLTLSRKPTELALAAAIESLAVLLSESLVPSFALGGIREYLWHEAGAFTTSQHNVIWKQNLQCPGTN